MRFLAFMLGAGLALADNSPRFTFSFPSTTRGTAAVAVDSRGNTYLAGTADGNDLNATPGAFQTKYPGSTCYAGGGPSIGVPNPIPPCHSPFVVKLNPFGAVVFATYLGGSSSATPSAIAFDSQGNVFVAGTVQGDFPVTAGAAFPAPPPPWATFRASSQNSTLRARNWSSPHSSPPPSRPSPWIPAAIPISPVPIPTRSLSLLHRRLSDSRSQFH